MGSVPNTAIREIECSTKTIKVPEYENVVTRTVHHRPEWSNNDYASRIELMCKVFGIDAVERYFDVLPIEAKTCEAYTSILHCCADAKLIDKAEDLYGKIESPNIAFNALVYNEMMTVHVRGAARRSSVCCRRNEVQEAGIVMHYVLLFETGSRKRIIDQWKHSSTGTDIIACGARLSEALRDVGALDSSDHLHMLLIKKELHF
ncbi:hypothetical protein MLD38_026719 [Melastoma candidum]|uniref:Uncharacterized protein n=1 Tax=Melastoma candidum TaxID=119954 RepID=A0ACB9NZ80_9MYRT|nr:hypothetical protein MLD38_026719 [Melastoma candidum]